jgi:hypothetical protein
MPNITSRGLLDGTIDLRLRVNPLRLPRFEVDASSEDMVGDLKIRIEDIFGNQYSRHQITLTCQGLALDGR